MIWDALYIELVNYLLNNLAYILYGFKSIYLDSKSTEGRKI